MPTAIEWTDETWNPVTGCTKVSAGCKNCYAKRIAKRLAGRYGYPKDNPFAVTLHPDRLEQPLRWRKPRMVFVCSMADLFHPDVSDEYIAAVFGVMAACPQHTFQVLTKRPDRMAKWFRWIEAPPHAISLGVALHYAQRYCQESPGIPVRRLAYTEPILNQPWPLPNVWIGTSAEDQKTLDDRLPHVFECPAAVRFVSLEPLLGPIDLDCYRDARKGEGEQWHDSLHPDGEGKLDWVIVGGETGPGARRMEVEWVESIRDQCAATSVPFFFKQWGDAWGKTSRRLHGREWNEMPGGK